MSELFKIASILTALGTISTFFIGIYKIIRKIEGVNDRLDEIDKSQCKNYLVRFLKDKERGVPLGEVEHQRAHEAYDHYSDDLNGNSYIHADWERLMK